MLGKIITIEGLDGAGKSTQIDLMIKKLESLGLKYKYIHFPMLNKGVYGGLIAKFLRGEFGELDDVHPTLVALLFAEDRKEHKSKLLQWLSEGYVVILDRYVNSNIAFQCAKVATQSEKDELKSWILDFEFNHNDLPKPDISFFLDVPLEIIEKSLQKERTGEDRAYLNGKEDIHESSFELQRNVYQEYNVLLDEQADFHRIDCFSDQKEWLSPEDIHNVIFSKINEMSSAD
ncbi:dTMP kinase [Aureibacter tunicatorum]|uniref:Thymidylate kinase n=1 Tax=Aureibacter tunicatorum TaxID=866807 RepID=A0AAE3XLP1_9BACT|nr:dTMP kinase [Aureibacter tunicatorum]MDR6238863.1 dTMP kinase [Aureibacter tunicatorum]BDD05210.1 thymidylate kinase [Aureibacter tunicatorum]